MNFIIFSVFSIFFIFVRAEDCFNYDTPIKDGLMLKDVQDKCLNKSQTEGKDYVDCIECLLGFMNNEKKEPNFEFAKEFLTKMVKLEKDKETLVKAVDDCKKSEYVGEEKTEKYKICWRKHFIEVCGKDVRVSGPRGL